MFRNLNINMVGLSPEFQNFIWKHRVLLLIIEYYLFYKINTPTICCQVILWEFIYQINKILVKLNKNKLESMFTA